MEAVNLFSTEHFICCCLVFTAKKLTRTLVLMQRLTYCFVFLTSTWFLGSKCIPPIFVNHNEFQLYQKPHLSFFPSFFKQQQKMFVFATQRDNSQ